MVLLWIARLDGRLVVRVPFQASIGDSSGLTISGIAFRMATKLGLQLDCSRVVAMGEMSDEAAQNRLVTFWGSYVEDR